MEKTKIVAFRIDTETLAKIDKLCSGKTYRNRSMIINQCLNAVLTCASPLTQMRIIDTYDPYSSGYFLTFQKLDGERRNFE